MKSFLAIAWIIIFLIISIPAMIIMKLTYKKNPWKAEKIARFFMELFMKGEVKISGAKVHISGLENVPEDTAVVYIANHRSYFDIVCTYPLCKKRTSYIAKSELQKIPFFGFWGKNMQCLFFDRNDMKASVKMILDGIERLKNGNSIFIFPEGGRNHSPALLPLQEFKDGSFKLASKSGCPVIPVAIKNMDQIWEAHSPWLKSADVSITYGKPVWFNDLDDEAKKHPGNYFKCLIEDMLKEDEI